MNELQILDLFRSGRSTIDIANTLVSHSRFSSGWRNLLENLDETMLDYTNGQVMDMRILTSNTRQEIVEMTSFVTEYTLATIFDALKETATNSSFGRNNPILVFDTKMIDERGSPVVISISPDSFGGRKLALLSAPAQMKFASSYRVATVEISSSLSSEGLIRTTDNPFLIS